MSQSIETVRMLIHGGSAEAVTCGLIVLATAPFDWQGAAGLVGVVGGVLTSLYGLYVQDRRTNSRVDELTAEAEKAKDLLVEAKATAQKEIDRLTEELVNLRDHSQSNTDAIQEIKQEQATIRKSGSGLVPSPNSPLGGVKPEVS